MRRLLIIAFLFIAASAGPASAGVVPDQYIVVLEPGVDEPIVAADHARHRGVDVLTEYGHALNGYAAKMSSAVAEGLRRDRRVLFVTPDRTLGLAGQTVPTGIDRIDAELSSARSGDGRGSVNVNVAVIDIGIDATHPDLNVQKGKDCSAPGSPYSPTHGTEVAGVIGAKDNAEGVVGVAPGAKLFPVRLTNHHFSIPYSEVICGIDWVTSTRTDKSKSNDIAVVNMSLVGQGADDENCGQTNADPLHRAICNSTGTGVVYVAAATNESSDMRDWVPAAYDEVLTATGMADSDGRPGGLGPMTNCTSNFQVDDTAYNQSNYATLPADVAHTIAAPGVCVLTTRYGGGYGAYTGTSFASPHVAGAAALCIARGACTGSPAQIIQKLRADAAAYNVLQPGYGFAGDPLRPQDGRYYGYLIRAAGY